jgi:hypothetical protein
VFQLMRQRDFVARLSSNRQKVKVEPLPYFPQLRAQRNQKLRIGPLDQLRP